MTPKKTKRMGRRSDAEIKEEGYRELANYVESAMENYPDEHAVKAFINHFMSEHNITPKK